MTDEQGEGSSDPQEPPSEQDKNPPPPQPASGGIGSTFIADTFLSAYIDSLAPDSFTVEANAVMISEAKAYLNDLSKLTEIYQRADQSEKALRKHVLDAAASLRSNQEGASKMVADWCKWIGFAFAAFMVAQFHNITQQNPIILGSVYWLVADVIVAAVFLTAGFLIDKPFAKLIDLFRNK
jgi:hypothetical protein